MASSIPEGLACDTLTWLPAEASGRRYGRLVRPRHVKAETAIVMLFRAGTRPAEVERVARATTLLAQAGLPVPEIHEVAAKQRWILQEDLGDVSLASARQQGRPVASAYSEAIGWLQRLQPLQLDTSPRPPLDAKRLLTELHLFAVCALRLPDGAGPSLAAELDELVAACTAQPIVLCHRDYHARNLMLKNGKLRILDHQDALPGPEAYDRVSLAYDPYVELADPIRDRIAGDVPGVGQVAVQRLAKAIGTYADKGGSWLRWIPPAARQSRRLIARHGLKLPLLDLAFATLVARPPVPSA